MVCVGNCTMMSASSRVTVLTVTRMKYNSLGSSQGSGGLSITRCTFLGCCLVVGGCDVDILCVCCLDLQTSAQWFCFQYFAECTPGGAHFVSGMCSSTIAKRLRDGFNCINELVRVCAVVVLTIFQFLELYYRHFIATAQLHGVLEKNGTHGEQNTKMGQLLTNKSH